MSFIIFRIIFRSTSPQKTIIVCYKTIIVGCKPQVYFIANDTWAFHFEVEACGQVRKGPQACTCFPFSSIEEHKMGQKCKHIWELHLQIKFLFRNALYDMNEKSFFYFNTPFKLATSLFFFEKKNMTMKSVFFGNLDMSARTVWGLPFDEARKELPTGPSILHAAPTSAGSLLQDCKGGLSSRLKFGSRPDPDACFEGPHSTVIQTPHR